MSKVLEDSTAASSTAVPEPEEGFADFQREQAEARASNKSVAPPKEPEVAPPSEAVVHAGLEKTAPVKPKQEALTDEEKSARKHASDGKRIPEFIRKLGEKDAEIERLKEQIASKGTPAAPTKDAKPEFKEDPSDPAPNPDDFKGDDAWQKYLRAEARWNARQEIREERERLTQEKADADARSSATTFVGRMTAYQETQSERAEEFMEAFTIVREALETEFPAVSSAIAAHEKAPELIDYLGTNLDVFSRITSAKGQPMAMKIFRGILADFEKINAGPVSGEHPRKVLPKPPVSITGRGRTPTGDEILDKAAEDDDFETAQKHFADQRRRR